MNGKPNKTISARYGDESAIKLLQQWRMGAADGRQRTIKIRMVQNLVDVTLIDMRDDHYTNKDLDPLHKCFPMSGMTLASATLNALGFWGEVLEKEEAS